MNVDFLSLEISGFKSFIGKPQRLTLAYAEAGLTFVRGRNEVEPALGANDAGKSTMFDALTWCLYGRTVGNLRNPDIKPWQGNSEGTSVTLKLKVDVDDKLRTITRTAAPNRLLLDKQDTNQEAVVKLLGIDFEVFSHTVLLGQGRPLFFDLPPRDKLDLFSNTLGLDRWENRSWKAAEQALELANQQATKEGEYTGAEAALEQAQGLLNEAKARSAEWEAERRGRVEQQAATIAEMSKKLEALELRKGKADLANDGALTELKGLEREIEELGKLKITTFNKLHEAKVLQDSLLKQEREIKKAMAEFGAGDACPTCGQSIKGTAIATHRNGMKKQLADLDKKIKESAGAYVKADNTASSVEGKLVHALKYAHGFRSKAESTQQELRLLIPAVAELQTKIRSLSTAQQERREEINPHHDQMQALRRKIKQADARLDELDKEIVLLGRRAERSKFWIKGFKDVRLYIIEEILQELELATNALLPESGLVDWEVRYDIEKETKSGSVQRGINVTILSPSNDKAVRWESWGGGVSQRLRIVGALALSEVLLAHAGVRTNLEILDEPTRHLSAEGVRDMCEFLAARAKQLEKNIIYIDHMAVESAHFASVITVSKSKNGSHIVEE